MISRFSVIIKRAANLLSCFYHSQADLNLFQKNCLDAFTSVNLTIPNFNPAHVKFEHIYPQTGYR